MQFRAINFFLLVFQTIFLNVIVPGHERGVVQLPGSACEQCCGCDQPATKSCCAGRGDPSKHAPKPDRASHCAICSFAAHLCVPPVFRLTLEPLGLAEILSPAAPLVAPSIPARLPERSRAPPVFA
jgi:hypothetical protein